MRLNFSSSGKALPDLRKDINAGGTSSVPEVSSSRRLPSLYSSSVFSASVSATRAFTGFCPCWGRGAEYGLSGGNGNIPPSCANLWILLRHWPCVLWSPFSNCWIGSYPHACPLHLGLESAS